MGQSSTEAAHECRCTNCWDFELLAEVQRLGHVSFRFKNADETTHVWIDGEEVTRDCIEAYPGTDGFVLDMSIDACDRLHYCHKCNRHMCLTKVRGDVRVETRGEVYQ